MSGERGIWTLAPVARPTPLAGAPLRPLEYFSELKTKYDFVKRALKRILDYNQSTEYCQREYAKKFIFSTGLSALYTFPQNTAIPMPENIRFSLSYSLSYILLYTDRYKMTDMEKLIWNTLYGSAAGENPFALGKKVLAGSSFSGSILLDFSLIIYLL